MAMSTGVEFISERAASYGMPGVTVNGNDPVATWKVMGEAIARARRGEGPTLVEARTYRFWGHLMGDAMEYMDKEERKAAMDADPVVLYREWLLANGHATEDQLAQIEEVVTAAIDDAVEFAVNSPFPDAAELYTDVYAEAAQ